ncbi:MAG: ABC transporter substrate-binding protein [Actinobacteria bacterium]|nr:ABC transporter substrate-binding protein [Actinomycetota bacterium]MBV9935245.1 ABC transporter substrate-binding protein [Actinomycetota bacterium]
MGNLLRRLEANRAMTFIWLAAATMVLLVIAIVGALVVKKDHKTNSTVAAGSTQSTDTTVAGAIPGDTSTSVAGGTATTAGTTGGTTKATSKGGGSTATPGHETVVTLPSQQGATRVGVSNSTIKWGLHAPKTLQGVPWGLADDALKGVRIYLNSVNQQKVNGRTVTEYFADDKYDTNGGAAAGDTLITDDKVFFAEGTLGVDQIAQVAKRARASQPTPTPYIAGGGSEAKFKDIGMYQDGGSYDTHLIALVHFLDQEVAKPPCPTPLDGHCPLDHSPYSKTNGKTKIGISALNSEYIVPAVDATKAAIAQSQHLVLGDVVTVEKPEGGAQTTYTNQVLKLSNDDIVIPAQDPLSTSGEVRECKAQAATCHFKWAFSDFAHDGDVDLALMAGSWTGYRGLSGGCYYLEWNNAARAPKCAKLTTAHDMWVHGTDPAVDNGGGDKGDGSQQSESTWRSNGQAGIAGYQVVHIWLKALKDAGTDLTREKFIAALNAYSNYDDLISTPITFAGSPNRAHGVNGFAVYQANAPDSSKPKGVGYSQLSDGLVGNF